MNRDIFFLNFLKEEKIHMAFLIKNVFLKARKLILKLEKISTQDFNCKLQRLDYMFPQIFGVKPEVQAMVS